MKNIIYFLWVILTDLYRLFITTLFSINHHSHIPSLTKPLYENYIEDLVYPVNNTINSIEFISIVLILVGVIFIIPVISMNLMHPLDLATGQLPGMTCAKNYYLTEIMRNNNLSMLDKIRFIDSDSPAFRTEIQIIDIATVYDSLVGLL
jgi:hypothetical protein